MLKRVLMVAFHFPPQRGSSGIQRTLKFSQYLPQAGWQPMVLSAHPRAYASSGNDQMGDIGKDVIVERAFALDASRHMAIKGRYIGVLALPDRWVTWLAGALPSGLRMIRAHKPDVIWSTYPIATAHLIGLALHRMSGLPWVADMRDPMTAPDYPTNPMVRRANLWVEGLTVRHASRIVFTTPGAVGAYRARYPEVPAARFCLIENGYDEENFAEAGAAAQQDDGNGAAPARPLTLIHSGIIYPHERNPEPFLEAIAALQGQGKLRGDEVRIVLRATVHDDYLNGLIGRLGIGAIVSVAPHIAYRAALSEMMSADGLLVLQGSVCNHQIPAKLYEYLRARRPILALTDPAGDTAATLRKAGVDSVARLDSSEDIQAALLAFIGKIRAGTAPLPTVETSLSNSRTARAAQLAALLDEVVREHKA